MKININTLSILMFSSFREALNISLTARQQKVMGVALAAIALLAVCYFLFRSRCPDRLTIFSLQPPDDKAKSLALVAQAIDASNLEQRLLLEAIEKDPKSILAHWHLANHLQLGQSVKLLDGTEMTKQQLYIKIIEMHPDNVFNAQVYEELRATVAPGESIQVLGAHMVGAELWAEAQRLASKILDNLKNQSL